MLEPKPEERITSSDVVKQLEQIRVNTVTKMCNKKCNQVTEKCYLKNLKTKDKPTQSFNLIVTDDKTVTTKLKEINVEVKDLSNNLGKGGFGEVFRGEWKGNPVASNELNYPKSKATNKKKTLC